MSDFFTPIQVIPVQQEFLEQYEIHKYENDPLMPASVKIESLADIRRKVIQWLKNMPIASRVSKLTYTNKDFSCLLMAMFEKTENHLNDCLTEFGISYLPEQQLCFKLSGFSLHEERYNRKPNPLIFSAEQELLNNIIIANRYSRFDSITIDSSLAIDINHLFDLFEVIENGVSYELTSNNYQLFAKEGNEHFLFCNPEDNDPTLTKTLCSWFVEVMKKNIYSQYFQEIKCQPRQTSHHLSFLNCQNKKNEIGEMFKSKAKLFKKYWRSIQAYQKHKLIEKVFSNDISDILNEYSQIIKIDSRSFPRIKYSHPDHIRQFAQDLVAKDGENLLNELVFTRIQDSSYEIATFKYDIIVEIEHEMEKKEREEIQLVMRKKTAKPVKIFKLSNRKTSTCVEKKSLTEQILLSKDEIVQSQTINSENKEDQELQQEIEEIKIVRKHSNYSNSKRNQKSKSDKSKNLNNSFEGCKQMSETTNDQDQDEEETKLNNLEKEMKRKENAKQQFNKVIRQFNQKVTNWNKHQQMALNRIATILHSYNLSYQLFGSFANGLAISSSDIDISIDPTIVHYFYGSFCSYKQKIIQALQFLQSCFEQMGWASNFNLVTTASVPVLIFEVDLGIVFGDPKNQNFNPNKNKKTPKICVDMTIQPFANMVNEVIPHLGIDSTSLVQQWMNEYPQLRDLVRICKYMLNKQNLNKSFTGGLSSYTITSILYSFLKNKRHERRDTIGIYSLILEFCDFVANFNETSTLIQPLNPNPIQRVQLPKLTVLNYLNGKNLAQNCFKFMEIKNCFLKFKQTIQNLGESQKQYCKKLRALLLH